MAHDLRFDVYEDSRSEWRWTCVSIGNSRKVADSGEGYKNHFDCIAAINLIKAKAPTAVINDPSAVARLMGISGKRTILG